MSKPSQRHSTHVQPTKPGAAEVPAEPTPAEPAPVVVREKSHGGLWAALLIWMVVFSLLYIHMLVNLVMSLFRR